MILDIAGSWEVSGRANQHQHTLLPAPVSIAHRFVNLYLSRLNNVLYLGTIGLRKMFAIALYNKKKIQQTNCLGTTFKPQSSSCESQEPVGEAEKFSCGPVTSRGKEGCLLTVPHQEHYCSNFIHTKF